MPGNQTSKPGPLRLRTLDGGTTHVPTEALDALGAGLTGELLHPADAGYAEAVEIWNGMVTQRPGLVVRPANTDDVAAVVTFARDHGLQLSIKGGGHNIAGTALADGGLTLDMARMNAVDVDPEARMVTVGPGCRLADVDAATQKHGLATVLGFVSETGVAGLTLGGGLGYLTRRFGWTVDNLLAVEVVTADGRVRRASRDEESELFWALRGGGGNFGVVTAFTFRCHEVGPQVVAGVVGWPAETEDEAKVALRAYRDLTEAAPRELAVFGQFMRAPPAPFIPEDWHGRRVILMLVCHTGDAERAADDLAPLHDALGEPLFDLVAPRPYAEQQGLIDETEPRGMHYYWKTEFLSAIPDELIDVVAGLAIESPVPCAQLGFLHIGGAVNERPHDDGAVGNRDARYAVGINAMWDPDEPNADAYRTWVREAWSQVRPHSTGASYINFQGADEGGDRVRETYGKNLERLLAAKRRYDPGNLFRVNKNLVV